MRVAAVAPIFLKRLSHCAQALATLRKSRALERRIRRSGCPPVRLTSVRETPVFRRLGDLCLDALALQEQRHAPFRTRGSANPSSRRNGASARAVTQSMGAVRFQRYPRPRGAGPSPAPPSPATPREKAAALGHCSRPGAPARQRRLRSARPEPDPGSRRRPRCRPRPRRWRGVRGCKESATVEGQCRPQ